VRDLVRSDDLLDEAREARDEVEKSLVALGVPGELVLTGSASVPGALTKGDIDLHLRVAPDGFEAAVVRLRLAYPVGSPHSWAETLAVFDVPRSRATGLAVTPVGSEHDRRFTRAWEELRSRPELLLQYNALKLASTGAEDYEVRKSDFFTAISEAL
jgi:GrpB-like predicted nucleotidyltransferase (UPF0157 family)